EALIDGVEGARAGARRVVPRVLPATPTARGIVGVVLDVAREEVGLLGLAELFRLWPRRVAGPGDAGDDDDNHEHAAPLHVLTPFEGGRLRSQSRCRRACPSFQAAFAVRASRVLESRSLPCPIGARGLGP